MSDRTVTVIHMVHGCAASESVHEELKTIVALEATCEDCRSKVFIGPVTQRGCEARTARAWMTEPMADADKIIDQARKNRG